MAPLASHRCLVFAVLALLVVAAPPARADECTGAKLKVIGKMEAGLLACHTKAATKGDASGLAACITKEETKYAAAFAKAGGCSGDQAVCECLAENCATAVRADLPDAGPSKCEGARLKAAGKKVAGKLGCNANAAAKGVAVEAACIAKVEAKYQAAFAKTTGCTGTVTSVETTVDQKCVSLVGGDPTGGATVGALCASCVPTPRPDPVWTLGEQKTLLANGALGGLCYFPDMATVRVPGISALRLLTNAGICRPGALIGGTYLFEGPDIEHLQSTRLVMSHGGPGEFDNGYAGISGLYRHTDGRLYGFYHAEDQEGLPPLPGTQIPGYYASIGAAVSGDDGESWPKLGPVVTSSRPKEFTAYPNQNDRGVAEPGVVADPSGRYLYIYYSDHTRVDANGSLRGLHVAMARADLSKGPPDPGRWQKYYAGGFTEPGIAGYEDIVVDGRQLSSGAGAYQPHPTFSAHLDRYVMIVNVIVFTERFTAPSLSGLYVAFSDDAVTWSRPQQLVVDYTWPIVGKSLSWEANILWDDDSGKAGWLVYSYSENWGPIPHYMVGRRIQFE